MREKVATLIEMTQRSEEEVCCALNECDNNLERAVVFLLETLPVVSFKSERFQILLNNSSFDSHKDSLALTPKATMAQIFIMKIIVE